MGLKKDMKKLQKPSNLRVKWKKIPNSDSDFI